MAEEEKLSTWVSLIPEVYFDVIARVPPGGTLIGGLLALFEPNIVTSAMQVGGFVPGFSLLLFFILVSYAAGLILTPLSGLIAYAPRQLLWAKVNRDYQDLPRLCKTFPALQSEPGKPLKMILLEQVMCELVSSGNEAGQSLLSKMRAEAELCNNLSVSLFILTIFFAGTAIMELRSFPPFRLWLIFLFLSIWGAVAGVYRTWRLIDRQVAIFRVFALQNLSEK